MCGLVGIAGDTTSVWKDLFGHLLVVDSLRGTHSTGAAMVDRFNNEINMAKEVGHPFNLLYSEKYAELIKRPSKVLIGHNRYATMGKHNYENAHPFAFDKVVGAHNGTIDRWAISNLHNHKEYDTDSEAIFSTINTYGIEETVKHLQGAWALTWFDKEFNTINMLRNSKRPLYYAYSEDCCTLIWASELDMLKLVVGRSYKKIKGDEYYSVAVDTHLSWKIPDGINNKFEKPEVVERKGKKDEPITFHYGGRSNYKYVPPAQQQQHSLWNKDNKVTHINNFKKKKDVKKFRPPYKDHSGKIINKQHFEELVAQGCVFCGTNDIDWGDYIHPLKTVDGHRAFLCKACYEDDEIFEICENLV